MRNEWIRPALWPVGLGSAERHGRYAENGCEMTAELILKIIVPSIALVALVIYAIVLLV